MVKKIGLVLAAASFIPLVVSAQMMMGGTAVVDDHTKQEEAQGKVVWEKLQSKQTECAKLTEEDFEALGEYFMGQMLGDIHPAMNEMMTRMMGEEGEEAMHVAMGKRLSGCDPSAAYPVGGGGMMPMMNMMTGAWSNPWNAERGISPMMGYGYGYDGFGFMGGGGIFMLFFWILLILILIGAIRWIFTAPQSRNNGKTPLEILKERYAKGEIEKKEFEEKKKELGY